MGSTNLLHIGYGTENICNKTDLIYYPQPKKTLMQGKVCERKSHNDHLTFALVVNTRGANKLKHVIIYKSLCPRCFGRWLPTDYALWFANQMAWMTSYVFKSWMTSLDVHFKSQKRKLLLIVDICFIHSFEHIGRGESFVFNLVDEQYYCCFLTMIPSNVTRVVQRLDHGITAFGIGPFSIRFFNYSRFLEEYSVWCKACCYMMLSSVERDEPPNHTKQLEDVQDFTCKLEYWLCHSSWMWKIDNERNNK